MPYRDALRRAVHKDSFSEAKTFKEKVGLLTRSKEFKPRYPGKTREEVARGIVANWRKKHER